MYIKYHTEGLVLDSIPWRDSSKIFYIFTPDLGLVRVSGRSVRKAQGKLKSGLEDFTYGRFTFIRSKIGWKVTDAIPEANLYFLYSDKKKFAVCARFSSLLKKLLPEEEENFDLFDEFVKDALFLLKVDLSQDEIRSLESLTILRFLGKLGYLEEESWHKFLNEKLSRKLLKEFSQSRKKAVKTINESLKESQLI